MSQNKIEKLVEDGIFFCKLCEKFLSPPIIILDIGDVCSQCYEKNHESNNWQRLENKSLNKILEEIHFPCKYKSSGCKETALTYNDKEAHENTCKYMSKPCPMSESCNCSWKGTFDTFVPHIIENHAKEVIQAKDGGFFVESNCAETVKLLVFKEEAFLLKIQLDKVGKKLTYILLDTKSTSDTLDYSAEHQGRNNYIKIQSKTTTSYEDYLYLSQAATVKVNFDCLKLILDEDCNNLASNFKISFPNAFVTVDKSLIKILECPVCLNTMKSPIYLCPVGHSVCSFCKLKLTNCPSCQAPYRKSGLNVSVLPRNFSLEQFSTLVPFPCPQKYLGCLESFLVDDLDKHEKICAFKQYSCLFEGCLLKQNVDNLKGHLTQSHSDKVFQTSEYKAIIATDKQSCSTFRCLLAFDCVFKLSFRYDFKTKQIFFNVQLGPCVQIKEFLYKTTIFDVKNPYRKQIIMEYCSDKEEQGFIISRGCNQVVLEVQLIEPDLLPLKELKYEYNDEIKNEEECNVVARGLNHLIPNSATNSSNFTAFSFRMQSQFSST